MGKLYHISKDSKTNIVRIKWGKEVVKFNLHDELVINEDKISREAMEQPSVYGFLSMLQKKLIRRKDDLENRSERIKAIVFLRAKKTIDQYTKRPVSKEFAEYTATADEDYQDSLEILSKAKEDVGTITSCLRSFEQRANLIQTVSANSRKEII